MTRKTQKSLVYINERKERYAKFQSSVALDAALATAPDWLGTGLAAAESLVSADSAERSMAGR